VVSSGEVVSYDSVSKQTIVSPVRHLAEFEEAVALAASSFSGTSFRRIALVAVRVHHVAGVIVNADHGIMRAAAMLRVTDCIRDSISIAIPQPTEWQPTGNQIDAATISARADFVNVHGILC
jgi:hypothetical protein